MEKNKGGRPRKYTSEKKFRQAIDDYFKSITITVPKVRKVIVGYEDEEQTKPIIEEYPVLNNKGEQIMVTEYFENPSIISMSHYIGMTRETLNQYKNNPLFSDAIKEAKEKIEKYLETELYRQQGQVTGVIFNLKNNFGWKDKQEVDQTNFNINNNVESTEDTKEVISKILDRLK